ncbi:DNA methyltransferase [Brachybacterium endophyticum]|uniref:DNA methyltransferase n=1 Tax=Brachybacterium endophyticum TaxID=2182385 RepID=A0A2U2RGQ3_9MICO|nr:adenine-specific methyltransferase EcoRI family protein [Brachybacterium endophyticum]PWH04955.1 DNA methyltransferase [Brachybacterium endophyticum]
MAKNSNLGAARSAKKDEFYTQWADIEREMNAYLEYDPDVFRDKTILLPCDDPEWSNFTKFFALHFTEYGLKKLISTSYAPNNNASGAFYEPTLFELENPGYDASKSAERGRVFTLTPEDVSGDGKVDFDDLRWEYLEGDGDFRSDEVRALRDLADIIITNPPFSLIRTFIDWLMESGKLFSIIGPSGATNYKETFHYFQTNRMWVGRGFNAGNAFFRVPEKVDYAKDVYNEETGLVKFRNCSWFTNIDHGRRHEPMELLRMSDNERYSKHKEVRGIGYRRYYNFPEAIDVPYLDAIPSDFDGIMGVPSTFFQRYDPEQFEILGNAEDMSQMEELGVSPLGREYVERYKAQGGTGSVSPGHRKLGLTEPKLYWPFKRILIRHRNPAPKGS